MSDHVYKKVEIVGSSSESLTHAIENAVQAAAKSIKNTEWFEVSEIRGHISNGKVGHYQVVTKIGFRVDV